MHLRVFLSRWRSYRPCPDCGGTRLRPEALATHIAGRNIADISTMKIEDALAFFRSLDLPDWQRQIARVMLEQTASRLKYLVDVGLGYLNLDRTLRTLEWRRGSARGADRHARIEPGEHALRAGRALGRIASARHGRLSEAIVSLRDRGNSVVVVEHEESRYRAADQLIEIGPGAGERGGKVVFQGTPAEMEECPCSLTGDYLAGRRGASRNGHRRVPNHG